MVKTNLLNWVEYSFLLTAIKTYIFPYNNAIDDIIYIDLCLGYLLVNCVYGRIQKSNLIFKNKLEFFHIKMSRYIYRELHICT